MGWGWWWLQSGLSSVVVGEGIVPPFCSFDGSGLSFLGMGNVWVSILSLPHFPHLHVQNAPTRSQDAGWNLPGAWFLLALVGGQGKCAVATPAKGRQGMVQRANGQARFACAVQKISSRARYLLLGGALVRIQ